MTSIVEIQSQNYKKDSANILQYDTISSRYYLEHTVNKNLNVIGNNIIIDGFEVNHRLENFNYYFDILPGKAICDLSLIEHDTTITLNINTSYLDNLSEILIMLNYKYFEDGRYPIRIIAYCVHDNIIYPQTFNVQYDNILLAHFYFNNNELIQSDKTVKSNKIITFNGRGYEIYPLSNLFKQHLKYIDKLELLYNYRG